MAKKKKFSNTQEFSNRRSFDGRPLLKGKVLVPFRKDTMNLPKGAYVQDNFITMHLGGFRFELGFMPIDENHFSDYMREYWDDINAELDAKRSGRCILRYDDCGYPVVCSRYHKCRDCPKKGTLKRFNPNRIETISLDFEYDGECFDIPDDRQPSVEAQVLSRLEPDPELTLKELETEMFAYFDQEKPRYYSIMKMRLQGLTDKQIINKLGLSTGRGYEEIQNAYNAACDYLRLESYKIKKRSK